MRYYQLGLTRCDPGRAMPGFTLFTPLIQKTAYLINMRGAIVHRWDLPGQPGNYAYLMPNGNLLVSTWIEGGPEGLNAKGGLIQELDWDGGVVWEYRDPPQHHDFKRLSNGNTVYLAWEILPEEARKRVRGGIPGSERDEGIWGDYIREVDPAGDTVWEWHGYDHMDFEKYPLPEGQRRVEYAHPNSIAETPEGDILVGWRHNSMVGIIDKSTNGFKWIEARREFGNQHDAQILENGNMMLFVNNAMMPGPGSKSKVWEFDYRTGETAWEYVGDPPYTFSSVFISGAQRLPNGNTLICEGQWGRIFEVTPAGDIVWEYISPFFVPASPPKPESKGNNVFRAYRYAPDSPEIRGRLDGLVD